MGSKRYRQAKATVDAEKSYALDEAVGTLQQMPGTKFDEAVEISVSLAIDAKKSDQVVRGTVMLPHGTGKTRRVIVFCKGEKELVAKEAGADFAGGAELINKVLGGWMDFDVAVATPDMMRDVSRLGKLLGPRGLMPNPKAGTVTDDVAKAVNDLRQGKVEFKMDKLSNIHFVIGRRSFAADKLVENGRVAIEAILRARPSTLKGRMVRRMSLSSTMSPGIALSTEGMDTVVAEDL